MIIVGWHERTFCYQIEYFFINENHNEVVGVDIYCQLSIVLYYLLLSRLLLVAKSTTKRDHMLSMIIIINSNRFWNISFNWFGIKLNYMPFWQNRTCVNHSVDNDGAEKKHVLHFYQYPTKSVSFLLANINDYLELKWYAHQFMRWFTIL